VVVQLVLEVVSRRKSARLSGMRDSVINHVILGCITYIAALRLQYLNYKELIKLFMTTLGYLVILRQP